jgi:hypothetical protein
MFRSDEIGGNKRLDLGKVQMFYFTLIIVFAYAVALAGILTRQHDRIAELPALNPGVIALLGISHAVYLTTKTVSSTPTKP